MHPFIYAGTHSCMFSTVTVLIYDVQQQSLILHQNIVIIYAIICACAASFMMTNFDHSGTGNRAIIHLAPNTISIRLFMNHAQLLQELTGQGKFLISKLQMLSIMCAVVSS